MQSDSYQKVRTFILTWNASRSLKAAADACGMSEKQACNKAAHLRRKKVFMKCMEKGHDKPLPSDCLRAEEYAQLRRLSIGEPEYLPRPEMPGNIPLKHGQFLRRLAASDAATKRREQITFNDARFFWNITKTSNVDAAIASTGERLAEIEDRSESGEIRVLQHLHEWMQERFESQLRLMRAA